MSIQKVNLIFKCLAYFLIIMLLIRGVNHNAFIIKSDIIELDFKFEEISHKSGVDFEHKQEDVRPEIRNMSSWFNSQGSSVSVIDINNDGYSDIFLTTTKYNEKNKLYINNRNGMFYEQAEKYGLSDINKEIVTLRSIFFDSDNDGTQDLLILAHPCPKFFRYNKKNKKYNNISFNVSKNACSPAVAVNILDINNDGLLDIVFATALGFGYTEYANLPMGYVQARNGGTTHVMINKGNHNFEEVSQIERQKYKLFTNAIGIGDYRNSGNLDIWFATDFHEDELYIKDSDSYYKNSKVINYPFSKSGMSAEHVYFQNQHKPFIFVSHVFKEGYMPFGNTFYSYDGQKFNDFAREIGNDRCGWAWGTKFFDLNNDGYKDQYVANGYFSSNNKKSSKDYWYNLNVMSGTYDLYTSSPDKWPDVNEYNLAGNEKDCLYFNLKDKKFINISTYKNIEVDPQSLNGRGVAVIDIRNNGKLGLVVTNQKNKSNLYQTVHLNKNNWVGIDLVGTISNRDAIGAKVILKYDKKMQISEVVPHNGYASQSEKRLHFGLGKFYGPLHAEIRWPSGIISYVDNIQSGTYNIIVEKSEK